jgi:predicted MFS family arabinose efflux permease
MAIPLVTALSGAGQFTVFSYLAPYYRQELGATPAQTSLLFMWFGAFGLIGNLVVARLIDRTGADRAVTVALASMTLSLLLWPLAGGVAALAAVLVPWALGCFSSNSAQQARAGIAAPSLAPGLMALNTSAIYVGQAIGAALGGAIVAASGFGPLPAAGTAWLVAAIALSVWIAHRRVRLPHG